MRKDVILGMTIGGAVLAVVIIYLTVYTNHHDRHGVETASAQTDGGSGGSGDAPGQSGDAGTTGEYKSPVVAAHPLDTNISGAKPTILGATAVEKTDPVWGKKLWADTAVSVTPDPNGNSSGSTPGAEPQPLSPVPPATADPVGNEIPGGGAGSGGSGAKISLVPPATNDGTEGRTTPPTTPPASGKTGHTHKIQKGETLSTIAAAAYGSANLYPYILRANPKIDPTRLKLGTEITIPDISEVKGPEKATDKSAEKSADAAAVTHKVEPTVDPKTEYRVQAGDNLNKIATKLYGKISMVQSIYDLNKATIGDNPAKLKLGMVLKLPAAPATTN